MFGVNERDLKDRTQQGTHIIVSVTTALGNLLNLYAARQAQSQLTSKLLYNANKYKGIEGTCTD